MRNFSFVATSFIVLFAFLLSLSSTGCLDFLDGDDSPPEVKTVDVTFVVELAPAGADEVTVDLSESRSMAFTLEEQVGGGDTHWALVEVEAGSTTVSHTFAGVSADFRHRYAVTAYWKSDGVGILAESGGYTGKFEDKTAELRFSNVGPIDHIIIGDGDDSKVQGGTLVPATIRADGECVLFFPEDAIWRSDDVSTAVIVTYPRNSHGYVYGISPGNTPVSVDILGATDTASVGCDYYTRTGKKRSLFGRWESPTSSWERKALEFQRDLVGSDHVIVEYHLVDDPLSGEDWVEYERFGAGTETVVSFTQDESKGFITQDGVTQRSFSIATNDELEIDFAKADMLKVGGL